MAEVRDQDAVLRHAVIIAHGQPGAPAAQQQAVAELAERVQALMPPGSRVDGATLAAPESLTAAQGATVIYPLFMAQGWFTSHELPRRWAEAGQGVAGLPQPLILPPLGADHALPGLAHTAARAAADEAGIDPAKAVLLIAGHGSGRGQAAARATDAFAAALSGRGGFGRVITAFLEQAPFLAEAARGLGPALCLPFFATAANHVRDDIPAALAEAGFDGPVLAPLGLMPEVPGLIARALIASGR